MQMPEYFKHGCFPAFGAVIRVYIIKPLRNEVLPFRGALYFC